MGSGDRGRRHAPWRGDPRRRRTPRVRDPEPRLAGGARPRPRVVPRRLRGLLAHACGVPLGDAQPHAGGAAPRGWSPRPRAAVARRALRRAPVRGLRAPLREDRTAVRSRPGGGSRHGARLLPGLWDRVPRARDRDRVRGGLCGLDRGDRASGSAAVRVVVRRRRARDRAHRADAPSEPGFRRRRGPPPGARCAVAGTDRARGSLRRRHRRPPGGLGGHERLAVRRLRGLARHAGQPALLPRVHRRPHRRAGQRAGVPRARRRRPA